MFQRRRLIPVPITIFAPTPIAHTPLSIQLTGWSRLLEKVRALRKALAASAYAALGFASSLGSSASMTLRTVSNSRRASPFSRRYSYFADAVVGVPDHVVRRRKSFNRPFQTTRRSRQ